MEKDEKRGSSGLSGAQGAVKMGKGAAKAAKTIGKATAQAASGNLAGAAATLLTDPETLKKIIMVILIPVLILSFLVAIVLFALPMAIYEAVASLFEHIGNAWDEIVASNEYGGNSLINLFACTGRLATEGFAALGDMLGNAISSVWNATKNFFTGSATASNENQTEQLSDNGEEIGIGSSEAVQRLAVVKKAIAINDKYLIRAEQIQQAVKDVKNKVSDYLYTQFDDHDVYEWHTPIIYAPVIEHLGTDGTNGKTAISELENALKQINSASSQDELSAYSSDFNNVMQSYFPLEDNTDAIAVLSLAMVQYGGNANDLKLSDTMKYMGYYKDSAGANTTFSVGHIPDDRDQIIARVKDWEGTYKPQYIMEEWKHYMGELDREKIGENDSGIAKYEEIVQQYEESGVALVDLITVLDYPDLKIREATPTDTRTENPSAGRVDYFYYYRVPNGKGVLCNHEWSITTLFGTFYHRQVSVSSYIRCRDITEVAMRTGLWNGTFDTTVDGLPATDDFDHGENAGEDY